MEERYNKWHTYNQVTFYLEDFIPDPEECRILILKTIEQVIRDYLLLKDSELLNDKIAWITAAAFIFDDDYWFVWGDMELYPYEFLEIVDLDINWFRTYIEKRFNEKYGVKNGKEKRRGNRSNAKPKQRSGLSTRTRSNR